MQVALAKVIEAVSVAFKRLLGILSALNPAKQDKSRPAIA